MADRTSIGVRCASYFLNQAAAPSGRIRARCNNQRLSPPDATEFSARLKAGAQDLSNVHACLARHRASCAATKVRLHWAKKGRETGRAPDRGGAGTVCAHTGKKGATCPRRVASGPSGGRRLSLQEKQEAIMNFQFLWRGMTARPAKHLKARSSLVRRLVQAHDDPGKQRIRAWLRELDDEQLSNLGLTAEDIHALRG
jgi:uncharacterized protein YjiS (DUF1127 family)